MSKLYFCTDGVIRIRSQNEKHMFALKFIQEQEKLSDFSFWVQWWDQPIYFEKGLTLAQFFQCIEPWIEFWGAYTQVDLLAYMVELRKPTLISASTYDLDWLSLDFKNELRPQVLYPDDEYTSLRPSPEWHLTSFYDLTGYKIGKNEAHLIQWTPLNNLANLPIILNPKQILMIDEYFISQYGNKNEQLINSTGLGVNKVINPDDNEAQFSYLQGVKVHKMRDMMEGFFYSFDSSPEIRDSLYPSSKEELNDGLEEIDANEVYENELIETDFLLEDHNILFAKMYDDEDPYFENLLKEAKKDINSKIRIGKINEAIPPEIRISAWIKKE